MTELTELVLVRHASSTRREIGKWGRRYDAPLAAGFEEQLEHSRRYIEGIQDFVLMSSPLQRCLQTAQYIAPDCPIAIIDDFTAYHSGAMEELRESEISVKHPGYLEQSYSERFLSPRFGEESLVEQARRVARGLASALRVASDANARSIVIVGHYSSINSIAHMATNSWDVRTYGLGAFDLEDGELLRLSIDSSFLGSRLTDFNGRGAATCDGA
ncbi:MAG TPA: histidine phosphatase family protein [Anaerolineae bacterium]|nr:histidine phosphatase family protein [Anaerolineae bacterium]